MYLYNEYPVDASDRINVWTQFMFLLSSRNTNQTLIDFMGLKVMWQETANLP